MSDDHPLRTRAIEARLLDDRQALVEIALDLDCPPDLLERLAETADARVLLATLAHPAATGRVLERALTERGRARTLAALHPAASPELLVTLSRSRLAAVDAAVALHAATPPATLEAIGRRRERLRPLVQARLEATIDSWRALDAAVPTDRTTPQAPSDETACDPDVPLELLAAAVEGRFGTATLARIATRNPSASRWIGDLLDRVPRLVVDTPAAFALLSLPGLPADRVQSIVENLVRIRSPRQKFAGRDRRNRRVPRAPLHLAAIDLATRHPAWTRISAEDRLRQAASHPRVYAGLLAHPDLDDAAKARLRDSIRRGALGPAWSLPELSIGDARWTADLERLPLHLARGVARRPDLDPGTIDRLRRRGSMHVLAALAANPILDAASLEELSTIDSPVLRAGLAASPNAPSRVLDRLIERAAEEEGLFAPLARNPGLSAAQVRALAGRLGGYRAYARARLLARHPRLDETAAEALARMGAVRELVVRTDLPLAKRRAWIETASSPPLERLLPELAAGQFDRVFADPVPRIEALEELALNPALDEARLERIAENAIGREFVETLVRIVGHPAARPDWIARVLARARALDALGRPTAIAILSNPRADEGLVAAALSIAGDGFEVAREAARHPAAPTSFLREAVRSADPRVQESAAANPRLPLGEVLAAGARGASGLARLERTIAWIELGPGRDEILDVLAVHGRAIDPVGPDEILEAMVDPIAAASSRDTWLPALVAQGDWDRGVLLAILERLGTRALREAAARHARDPGVLDWLATRPAHEIPMAALAANPACPVPTIGPALEATDPGDLWRMFMGLERSRVEALLAAMPDLARRIESMPWSFDAIRRRPDASAHGTPSEFDAAAASLLAELADETRSPYGWRRDVPPRGLRGERWLAAPEVSGAERRVAALLLTRDLGHAHRVDYDDVRTLEFLARSFGWPFLAAALSAGPGADRPAVLTAAAYLERWSLR